jgi:hypothetical protein
MAFLRDVKDGASIYGPARKALWITLGLMVLTLLYAALIIAENAPLIGV